MEKTEEIMKTAMQRFSEKGYASTSMQEIADACHISKGTIYQFFSSKDDLLLKAIEHNYSKVLQHAANVKLDNTLSEKEKLVEKIARQFESIGRNKNFMVMLFRALPPHENPEIPRLMTRIKIAMANWYKDCLLEAYGDRIEPFVWDIAFMLQGVVKEYINLSIHQQKAIDFQQTARLIVDQFDTMLQHTTSVTPVLTTDIMTEYENFQGQWEPESPELEKERLFVEIAHKLDISTLSQAEKTPYSQAIQTLQAECHKEEPQFFLIRSLSLYLRENAQLKNLAERIESLMHAECHPKEQGDDQQ